MENVVILMALVSILSVSLVGHWGGIATDLIVPIADNISVSISWYTHRHHYIVILSLRVPVFVIFCVYFL